MADFSFQRKANRLEAKVAGYFTQKDGMKYVEEYQKNVKMMSVKEELYLDCTQLSVTSGDLLEMLGGCFEMYKNDFQHVTMKLSENIVLEMQLKRLARNIGLDLVLEK